MKRPGVRRLRSSRSGSRSRRKAAARCLLGRPSPPPRSSSSPSLSHLTSPGFRRSGHQRQRNLGHPQPIGGLEVIAGPVESPKESRTTPFEQRSPPAHGRYQLLGLSSFRCRGIVAPRRDLDLREHLVVRELPGEARDVPGLRGPRRRADHHCDPPCDIGNHRRLDRLYTESSGITLSRPYTSLPVACRVRPMPPSRVRAHTEGCRSDADRSARPAPHTCQTEEDANHDGNDPGH
jgi:hypothetical protein